LNHNGKVSGDSGFDSKGQSHDREGDGTTALGGCSCDHSAEHHRDGEQVSIYEINRKRQSQGFNLTKILGTFTDIM
jgi:hypothetical protein